MMRRIFGAHSAALRCCRLRSSRRVLTNTLCFGAQRRLALRPSGLRISRRPLSSVCQSPPQPDLAVENPEEGVDDYADDEDDDHDREQLLGVREISGELELLSKRRLVADDDDQLPGHEAAPRESPTLLEPANEGW